MSHDARSYIPAASYDWALPFYDLMTRLSGVDKTRRLLLEQADLKEGQRVLDVGCGTGALALLIEELHPGVEYAGLDPDPKALARARRKAARAGVPAAFDRGFAHELPYPDASFDRVFSSLMFHHIPEDQKPASLRELRRVLKPGGSLHLVDFGGPAEAARGLRGRLLRAHHYTRDNFGEAIPSMMKAAGFTSVARVHHATVLVGPLAWYRALREGDR